MSSILYYSNHCNHSKNLLQRLSKNDNRKDIHFICIDKRIQEGEKTYIILENNSKIVLPNTVTRVPALLLLNQGYSVLFGEDILKHFRPKEEMQQKQATQNNMEPMAYTFANTGSIVSDQYSFLDMDADALTTQGNGGMRQMHNYVDLNMKNVMEQQYPQDEFDKKAHKIPENVTIEQLQKQRDNEFNRISNQQPMK
jgi:hypothetical protein